MSKKNIKILVINLFLTTILLGSIIASVSAQLPVIDIEEDKATYSPTGIHYDSYYYTIPANTKFTNVIYRGTTGFGTYTTVQTNDFDYTDENLYRKSSVDDWFLENTSRTNPHPFFGDDSYPVGVQINSIYDPVFEQLRKKAINLHMDHSYTFLAENNIEYFGFVNVSEPFFLDVYLYDSDASGFIEFPDAHPFSYNIGTWEKMTYPIFPRINNQSSLLNFTLILTSGSSVVSLTPHPWKFPTWMPTIEANSSFVGEFSQGSFWSVDTKTGDVYTPENDLFSIRMFNISLEQDNYYKIFTDFNMRDGYKPIAYLIGNHYDHISGTLIGGEYYIYAEESENTTLVLFSPGYSHGDYSIYFQNLAPAPDYETLPLPFNTDTKLELETYYTLDFSVAHMMAINSTAWFGLDFYVQGAKEYDWIRIQDWWSFLYTPWTAIDDLDWLYIPAGTYAFECTSYSNIYEEIRFNAVPVDDPRSFTVNQDSILAIEIPLSYNRINLVNISTTTHTTPPERVWYEWTFVGMYNELVPADTGSGYLGNENITNLGVWEEWGSNNTNINAYLRTCAHQIPILLIRPYEANNWTHQTDPLPSFLATLVVSVNEAIDQSGRPLSGGGSFGIPTAYLGDGTFIPLSAISMTSSFDVNDEYTADNDHVYGIPLNLDPYSIYNITVYFYGNNSLSERNASFDGTASVYMHGGNLRDLKIFNSQINHISAAYVTNTSISMLILTVSSTTYLYVDMYRDWVPSEGAYANSTMEIIINKVSTNMIFDLPDYEYNDTASDQEVFTDDLLATQVKVPEMKKPRRAPGFELILALGTLVILTTGVTLKRRKKL